MISLVNNNDIKHFFGGITGGIVGTLLSHPIDTSKTIYQSDMKNKYGNIFVCIKDIYMKEGIRGFFKGIKSPLIGIPLEKSVVFTSSYYVRNLNIFKNHYANTFLGGVISGICCTLIVTPVEKFKIKLQNSSTNTSLIEILKKEELKTFYRGWSATLFREVPGYGIYFLTYEYLKNNTKEIKPYHSFIYGGLSGLAAWLIIYPSDPPKTLMQNENIGLKKALSKIYNKDGIKGFYKGFGLGLFRSIPLHAGVFLGYETFMKFFN
jgi:hypothetical protein